MKLIFAWIALFLLPAAAGAGTLSVVGQARWVHVAQVFDGDTFRTDRGERVRLLGINTPEVAHHNQREQAYAKVAKRRLVQLIQGKSVQLRLDKDHKDIYRRTLAQIYLRDGQWVNQIMVREGLAHVYTFAPNFYWTRALLKAEAQARNAMLGLWKSRRFRVLDAAVVTPRLVGQFHLVRGYVSGQQPWRFKMGKLTISIPRKSRQWFGMADRPHNGQRLLVRGVIRASITGHLYLAVHSPYDMESL